MNRRDSFVRPPWVTARTAPWALGALLLGAIGCAHQPAARLQSEEEEIDRYHAETIGDFTTIGNAEPTPLGGVGLVVGLDGTGGEAASDNYRTTLEDQLRKEGVKNVKEVLSSPNNALVVVTATLPPGGAKGDPIDVEVALPPHSKATSLRGGYLRLCQLFNYEYTKNLSPDYTGPNVLVIGHALAKAEGPVLVGFGDGDEAARVKRGRIWAGGKAKTGSPFLLLLNQDHQQARVAALAADRINQTFHAALADGPGEKPAVAHNNLAVELRVPTAYRLNQQRFLRVVRMIPLQESAQKADGGTGDGRSYRQRLADDLRDPAHCVVAALRLEALGESSIPILKTALEHEHPLPRFCAAEALAYLGSPSCAEELGKTVEKQPLLRAFALTALASLDEAASHVQLRELLGASADDETRYGAFRALRALDEHDPLVQGDCLNDSFWLHRVAPNAPPLVHVSSNKRAEIVLFGEDPTLQPPFSFLAGEFTVTATQDDDKCIISRIRMRGDPVRRQVSLKLEDVLRAMADMGAMYPETLDLLQQAHHCECLSCRVRCDALPQAVSVYDLARAGRGKSGMLGDDGEILAAPQDLGATPNLYEGGGTRK